MHLFGPAFQPLAHPALPTASLLLKNLFKIKSMKLSLFSQLLLPLNLLICAASPLHAQDEKPVTSTSITGTVVLPANIPAEINTTDLSLTGAIVKLEGKYHSPRMPRPQNWKEMTTEERQAWHDTFVKSGQRALHQEKVEAARAKRYTQTTTIAEDGTFTLDDVVPAWYQLTIQITPANVAVEPDFLSARAYALRQFFVKTADKPHQLGRISLLLKNVLAPGDVAPDFTITNYDGTTSKLSDLRGKYVLFDFWATWCGPCLAQIPHLEAIAEKFSDHPLVTLGLSVDDKQEQAAAFLKKKPSHYRQGYVGQKKTYESISTAYGFESIPSIWLIDPEGKIIAKNLIGPAILEAVEKALAPSKE